MISCASLGTLGVSRKANASSVQMPLYDARGIQNIQSRDRSIMRSSGGSGHKILRKVHSEDDPFCDWIQRPSFYGVPPPFFDFERIREAEEIELASRLQTGTALNRSQLPWDCLGVRPPPHFKHTISHCEIKPCKSKGSWVCSVVTHEICHVGVSMFVM